MDLLCVLGRESVHCAPLVSLELGAGGTGGLIWDMVIRVQRGYGVDVFLPGYVL